MQNELWSALVLRLALNRYEVIDTPPSPPHLTGVSPDLSEPKCRSDGPGYIECLESVFTPHGKLICSKDFHEWKVITSERKHRANILKVVEASLTFTETIKNSR